MSNTQVSRTSVPRWTGCPNTRLCLNLFEAKFSSSFTWIVWSNVTTPGQWRRQRELCQQRCDGFGQGVTGSAFTPPSSLFLGGQNCTQRRWLLLSNYCGIFVIATFSNRGHMCTQRQWLLWSNDCGIFVIATFSHWGHMCTQWYTDPDCAVERSGLFERTTMLVASLPLLLKPCNDDLTLWPA